MSGTPRCHCGREALSMDVRRPGPNLGRWFWRCSTNACNYFKWDTSAHPQVQHPTAAYSMAADVIASRARRVRLFNRGGVTWTPGPTAQAAPQPRAEKVIEFKLHSEDQISIQADEDATLIPALQNMAIYNDGLKRWMIPATYYDYIRVLQCIPTRTPNLNLNVKKLSPMMVQALQEVGQTGDEVDVRETNVMERTQHIKTRQRSFWNTLKPFQKEAIETAIRRNGRILLADEAGLGKKMQALGIALAYRDDWPVLVICDKGKEEEWSEMIQKWLSVSATDIHITTNRRNVLSITQKRKRSVTSTTKSSKKKKRRKNDDSDDSSDDDDDQDDDNDNLRDELLAGFDEAVVLQSQHKFHILSYEVASSFEKEISSYRFMMIIADESYKLKLKSSAKFRSIIQTLQNARRLVTIWNGVDLSRPIDLYTNLCSLRKDMFGDFQKFTQRYCNARQDVFGWIYNGRSNGKELEFIMNKIIWIKREKNQVQDQLPSDDEQG